MKEKLKIFTEKELEDMALKLHIQKLNKSVEKENYISTLPYSDDYPRIFHNGNVTCQTVLIRIFWASVIGGFIISPMAGRIYFSK